MNTSFAHLGLVIGGRNGASSRVSLVEREIVARDAPPLREADVMDAFGARRPMGPPIAYQQRVGPVVLVVGLVLIVLGALVS